MTDTKRLQSILVSDYRGTLSKYPAGFDNKTFSTRSYVAVENNERYRIRVYNKSSGRIGLVIAVDGRNIISGSRSNLSPSERMYILGPYGTGEFEGRRTGKNRVNRFYFTGMNDSYASAWDDYSAMGVIAIAVFKDRNSQRLQRDKSNKIRPINPRGGLFHRESPGTGLGEGEWSPSRTVRFSPRDKPVAREFIKYEYRSTLCQKGIVRCQKNERPYLRNRFWGPFPHDNGFVPFPPGGRIR